MKQLIIDRFEGEYAVCESSDGMINVARVMLPKNAKSGDVIVENNGMYNIDNVETAKRRERAKNLGDSLFRKL